MNGLDSIVINFPQVQLWQSVTSITAPSPRGAAASPPPPACGWRLRAARSPSPGDAASALRLCSPRPREARGRGAGAAQSGGRGREGAGGRPGHARRRPSLRPRARRAALTSPVSGGLRAQAAEAGHLRPWRPSLCAHLRASLAAAPSPPPPAPGRRVGGGRRVRARGRGRLRSWLRSGPRSCPAASERHLQTLRVP